jgi:proteasome accessory factor B
MDRTERLLDLVATLLDATEPVPLSRIRELFPDYAEGTPEANERKFERDKAELAELGIPLRYEQNDNENQSGYYIDRDAYYLPELKLRAEEWALLYTAGSAVLARGDFPGGRDLAHALRKISFSRGLEPVPQFSDALAFTGEQGQRQQALRETLEQLWVAVQSKKRAGFTYRSAKQEKTQRVFDPYGVALRRGQWIAVGFDHAREALRTFRVDRMQRIQVNAKKPKSPDFEVPASFHIEEHLHQQSWDLDLHEPLEVKLAIDPSLAPLGTRLFPHAKANASGTRLTLTVRNRDALVRQVLALGTRVQILAPDAVRARARELLEALKKDLGRGGRAA